MEAKKGKTEEGLGLGSEEGDGVFDLRDFRKDSSLFGLSLYLNAGFLPSG